MPALRSGLSATALVALLVTGCTASAAAAPVAQAPTKPSRATPARSVSPLPTCDEIAGATIKTSVNWRIFQPTPVGQKRPSGDRWACRRGPGPAQQFTNLSGLRGIGVSAGDLLSGSNDGRYNPESYAIDLVTGRFTVIDEYVAKGRRDLLGSGVLVNAPSVSDSPDPAHPMDPAYAPFGGDDTPAAGFYLTAADGSVTRTVPDPVPAAVTTADWRAGGFDPASPASIASAGFQAAKHRGVVVTPLPGQGYELEARAAGGTRPATLEIHRSGLLAYGPDTRRASDRIARLVPGSEPDARAYGPTVVVGRFLDHPSDVRARFMPQGSGTDDQFQLAFAPPAPTVSNPYATDVFGDTAIVSGDRILIFLPGYYGEGYSLQTVVAPGAHDVAIIRAGLAVAGAGNRILYWTDADGKLHREALTARG